MNTPHTNRKVFVIGDEDRKQFLALDGVIIRRPRTTESLIDAAQFQEWQEARNWWKRFDREIRDAFPRIYAVILTAQIEPDPSQGDININLNAYFPQMADLLVLFETAHLDLEHMDMRARIADETGISGDVLHNVSIPLQFMMAEIRRAQREVQELTKFRQTYGLPALERRNSSSGGSNEDLD